MENKLAENIRAFRKQRMLTQEQLAEVLGVTVGAVYKWEARLSQPELSTIMELADFFDTSVDVLLGYELKDNRLRSTAARLKKYQSDKDEAGLAEAEKALKKYPNSFEIVFNAAGLFSVFGTERGEKRLMRRALELLEKSRQLIAQNTNPRINESTLCGNIAEVLRIMGEAERAVEMLKANNAGGMYSDIIGLTLAEACGRPEEAMPFLSESLVENTVRIIRTVFGYINVFFQKKDYASAKAVLNFGLALSNGLRRDGETNFTDKTSGMLYACLAYSELMAGNAVGAEKALLQAKLTAERFDANPNYSAAAIRFVSCDESASAYDDIGATAAEGVRNTVCSLESAELTKIWERVNNDEKRSNKE